MIFESNAEYHANKAISHSKLETFRRRPALYYKKFVAGTYLRPPTSPAFRLGSAAHCAVLEPKEFSSRYVTKPVGLDRRTKEGKEAWGKFEFDHAGKTFLDEDEMLTLMQMTDAVRGHPLASDLLADGQPEISWRNDGALKVQCRTDWFSLAGCTLSNGRPYVADLKTVESLEDGAFGNFERAVFRFGYHRQAGFYLPLISEILGRAVFDFFFIAVEKVEPFGVAVYRLSDEAVSVGTDESIADLRRLNKCIQTNDWPNIEPVLHHLGLPKWYAKGEQS